MTGAFWMLIGSLGAIGAWAALSYVQVRRGVKSRLEERTSLESRIEALRADENRLQDMIARKEKADRAKSERSAANEPADVDDNLYVRVPGDLFGRLIDEEGRHFHPRPSDILSRWVLGRHAGPVFPTKRGSFGPGYRIWEPEAGIGILDWGDNQPGAPTFKFFVGHAAKSES